MDYRVRQHLLSVADLRRLRSEIRWHEFNGDIGGGCNLVAEAVSILAAGGIHAWMTGFEPVSINQGCYVTTDGRHIAHAWNVVPSGRILDVTADQFDDGADIRITSGNDPHYDPSCGCGKDG